MEGKKFMTLLEAMSMFDNLMGEAPSLDYWGIRSPRIPSGKSRIHLTAVPFDKDRLLVELAAAASVEGEPLLAYVLQGDPDDGVEALVEKYDRRIGKWEVNPYNNVLITTFAPECRIASDLTNSPPKLRSLIEHIETRYIPYDQFPAWGKKNGLVS